MELTEGLKYLKGKTKHWFLDRENHSKFQCWEKYPMYGEFH